MDQSRPFIAVPPSCALTDCRMIMVMRQAGEFAILIYFHGNFHAKVAG